MNIDDYRAMVAEEQAEQKDSPKGEQPDAQTEHQPAPIVEESAQAQEQGGTEPQVETLTSSSTSEQSTDTPELVEVDGKKITLDELKNGFMRQSDYTRKTQELARNKEQIAIAEQYYKAVNNDPELAQELAAKHNLPYISPSDARVKELESRYNDLLLQQEISTLEAKYDDVNIQEVVKTAYDKGIANLEDAYLLTKAANQQQQGNSNNQEIDIEAIKEQIRQELASELKSGTDTTSVINSGGTATPVVDNTPELTPAQARVAAGMGLSPKEYAKWSKK